MSEVKIKEADLQIIVDMQKQIDEMNDAMGWCVMCLGKGEVIPHPMFEDIGNIKMLTNIVMDFITKQNETKQ